MNVDHMNRLRILQLPVDLVTMSSVLQFIDDRVRSLSAPACIVCANPEKVFLTRSAVRLRRFFEAADLVIPDGIGIVIAARLLFGCQLTRVRGADLMQAVCSEAPERQYRIFIYGGTEAVNRQGVGVLRQRYPGIQIVGAQHGYLPADRMDTLISRINDAQPDILFVGLGSPRQEMWIQRYLPELRVKVIQGVGGTLDTIAGTVKRAPLWTQSLGLEWLYRLVMQPSRARRQVNLVRFAAEILRVKFVREHA